MTAPSTWTTTWRQIQPRDMRSTLRSWTISSLAGAQAATGSIQTALQKPRVQVLLMHHIFEDEEQAFRNLLSAISRNHQFITYSDAVNRIESGQIDKPYVTFTFDDGFQNNVRAAQIMNEFNARACFFACPAIVGETNVDLIRSFCRDRLQLACDPIQFMSWADLESLRNAGHEIGGHTMTHANLARISQTHTQEEIGGSFNAIKSRLGEAKHFAWTFGRFEDFTPEAAKIVFRTGYQSCASGVRGAHPPHQHSLDSPPCIRRDHIVAAWPVSHPMYFMAKSSQRMSSADNQWPSGWPVART